MSRSYLHGLVKFVGEEERFILDTLNWPEEKKDTGTSDRAVVPGLWVGTSPTSSPQTWACRSYSGPDSLTPPSRCCLLWLMPRPGSGWFATHFRLRCLPLTTVSSGLKGSNPHEPKAQGLRLLSAGGSPEILFKTQVLSPGWGGSVD